MTEEICKCLDLSHWQGFPDFEAVADAGVIACIMKATEGSSYIDPNRALNYVAATEAGIACATYHWLSPGNARSQMEFYLSVVDPVPDERMVIDYEQDGCTLNDLHEAIETLLDSPCEVRITVYSGHLLKDQLGPYCDDYLAENCDLWLAQYTEGEPSWPEATFPEYRLWQYSDTGTVAGIEDTHVDLNRFNGSDAELVAWINPAKEWPARPPLTTRQPRRLLIPRGPDLRDPSNKWR